MIRALETGLVVAVLVAVALCVGGLADVAMALAPASGCPSGDSPGHHVVCRTASEPASPPAVLVPSVLVLDAPDDTSLVAIPAGRAAVSHRPLVALPPRSPPLAS